MRVVALGDSITEGYLCYPQDSWVAIVANELQIEMYNLGICGDLTRDMRRRMRRQVLPLAPSHCIILGGANDAFCQVDLEDYSENIEIIVEYCWRNDIIPVLGIPTPTMAYPEEFILQAYRDWLREYAEEKKITIIDFYAALVDATGMMARQEFFLDEVHPNVEGYRAMAEAAGKVLRRLKEDFLKG
ncbi:MAG TPA: lysophospholipase [Peptococcaceae bacterium]|nr:lysophospholipase [Peptococcaceae bacterium]